MAKESKKAKGKKGAESADDTRVHLAGHPRAARSIATAKGWGGLLGFVVVGWLSYRGGLTEFDAGLRALAGGIGFYLLAWATAVTVWREIAVAEVARARRRIELEQEAYEAAQAMQGSQTAEAA